MRRAHPRERVVGMEWYVSESEGIGGQLKRSPEDFRVEELEGVSLKPIESDPAAYPFLILRVTLTGWDTFAFADRLGAMYGLPRQQIRWAGTKDKHAVTTQLFSVQTTENQVPSDIPNASITPVGRFGRALTFGDLLGNAFQIRVREPEGVEHIATISEELRKFGGGTHGVPNYFGPQRFGSRRPITHKVGLALLNGDWADATMAYLGQPDPAEPAETREARKWVEDTHDWAGALERFPAQLDHERCILRVLADVEMVDDATHRAALAALPETLQQLFVHAAQSYLFNRILSARLEADLPFDAAVVGDVVCFAQTTKRLGPIPDPSRIQHVTQDRLRTINRHIQNGRAFVTAPLVGTDMTLGEGEPGNLERTILEEMQLDTTSFELPEPYRSRGTRRAIMCQTDLQISREPVTFSFALPSGAYATVLLREFLKVDPIQLS